MEAQIIGRNFSKKIMLMELCPEKYEYKRTANLQQGKVMKNLFLHRL